MNSSNLTQFAADEEVAKDVRAAEKIQKAHFEAHQSIYGDGAPYFSPATAEFWNKIREGKFTLSSCKCCQHVYFPPRVICPNCWAADSSAAHDTPGLGKLVSYTDLYVTAPRLKDISPLRMAIVDLDEGVRVLTWLRGSNAETTKIGKRCSIVVEELVDQKWFVANAL